MALEDTSDASGGVDRVEASISHTLGFGIENLVFLGEFGVGTIGDVDGTGNALNNRIGGTPGRNVLKGLHGDDVLNGWEDSDRLLGGEGDDEINGGREQDRLNGGGGDDQLDGGADQDRLSGANGNDAFLFTGVRRSGDIITDFLDEGARATAS